MSFWEFYEILRNRYSVGHLSAASSVETKRGKLVSGNCNNGTKGLFSSKILFDIDSLKYLVDEYFVGCNFHHLTKLSSLFIDVYNL